jgi:hypothetical protein
MTVTLDDSIAPAIRRDIEARLTAIGKAGDSVSRADSLFLELVNR